MIPFRILLGAAITLAAATASAQPTHGPGAAAAPCAALEPLDGRAASEAHMPSSACANRANLEVMADRPSDLAHGRRLGPADGAREAAAVEAYRKGQVKASGQGTASSPAAIQIAPAKLAGDN